MARSADHFWRKAPFIKLLLALITGILLQWYFPLPVISLLYLMVAGLFITLCFFFIPFFERYKYSFVAGIAVFVLFFSAGALLTWHKDIRNNRDWLGYIYKEKNACIVSLLEPAQEKIRSYKAEARVNFLVNENKLIPVQGKIILYFRKDAVSKQALPGYGSRILLSKSLQEIRNSGNPGGFDYKRYALFRGITHQVFLDTGDYKILPGRNETILKKTIMAAREKILGILRNNIKGDKELGLAEALLVGYKDDLDQSLLRSYANTGVVHIIAISGLHLGLIYWLLLLLLKPFRLHPGIRWIRPVLIIAGLWSFSLLAGAQPSVLRSALMFTFIVLGDSLARRSSIYNTMAASAFLLLCIDPFWLWDIGFQLSYTAVLSIVIFLRPIYRLLYINNKLLDFIWKMNAVTIAAQILTTPLSIYHFHQFPLVFLLTNIIAVPLSSILLLGEIFLCILSFIPAAAFLAGKMLFFLIGCMNRFIQNTGKIPFSLWEGLQVTIIQSLLLLFFSAGIAWWLMERAKAGLKFALIVLAGFILLRSHSFIVAGRQEKIIVYNIPRKRAIDFIDRRNFTFIGDSTLLTDAFNYNFHLKPSRTQFRVSQGSLHDFFRSGNCINYRGKHILLLDQPIINSIFQNREQKNNKPFIDLLVISGNPKLYMKNMSAAFEIKQVVFDGTVPAWKSDSWKKDCDSLKIPCYDVKTKGAFVMNCR